MITKEFPTSHIRKRVRVTFRIPGCTWADRIDLALTNGDSVQVYAMHILNDGEWHLALELPMDRVYRFSYLRDETQWMGDMSADGYEENPQDGTSICLLDTHAPVSEPLHPRSGLRARVSSLVRAA